MEANLQFTHNDLVNMMVGTSSNCCYDIMLGETIYEKSQNILVKITEMVQIVIAKSGAGYVWLAVSPIIYDHISSFVTPSSKELYKEGSDDIEFYGIIKKKWMVFVDPLLKPSVMYIGNTMEKNSPAKHFAKLYISNIAQQQSEEDVIQLFKGV